jgi:hypothetical protein
VDVVRVGLIKGRLPFRANDGGGAGAASHSARRAARARCWCTGLGVASCPTSSGTSGCCGTVAASVATVC